MRAIFEPHQVRTDRLPGQLDIAKDGLVRVFDTTTNEHTYLFIRGDERRPDTNQIMQPGVPVALAAFSPKLDPKPILLPRLAAHPDKRAFVIRDTLEAAQKELDVARTNVERAQAGQSRLTKLRRAGQQQSSPRIRIRWCASWPNSNLRGLSQMLVGCTQGVLRAEALEDSGQKNQ